MPKDIKLALTALAIVTALIFVQIRDSYQAALTQCEKSHSTETCINQLR